METRKIVHQELFSEAPETVFALLHTPSAILEWWGATSAIVLAKTGGTWAATWGEDEDDPDYISIATISDFDPPKRMVLSNFQYHAKAGPLPFRADFTTSFEVIAGSTGTTLRVTQDGFPVDQEADDFYAACQKGWQDTFIGIREYLRASNDKLSLP
jgi:uncharacterized protein YndB with AHSA1/START domain